MLNGAKTLIREQELIPPQAVVLCAVSGGADSMCLLHWLSRQEGILLHAAHFNHRLREEESERDALFVRDWCLREGIPFHLGAGNVRDRAEELGCGIEETARELRYTFLRQTAAEIGADRIATAHTANDNAETMLLHLIRGSGLRGLTGISPRRGDLIRPLLTTSRQEVMAYLELHGVPHIEDSTNQDERYLRNRVRRQLVPLLEEWNPGFVDRMTESIPRLREDDAYLNDMAEQKLAETGEGEEGTSIRASVLASLPDPVAYRMARLLFARAAGGDTDCTAAHLRAIVELSRDPDPSGAVDLPHEITARREYDKLILSARKEEKNWQEKTLVTHGITRCGRWIIVCGEEIYAEQPQGKWEFWLEQKETLSVRPRRTGDALALPRRPCKTVKKWMIEEKLPRQLRDTLPVLILGGRVVAVAGLGPDAASVPQQGQSSWHITVKEERLSGKEEDAHDGTGYTGGPFFRGAAEKPGEGDCGGN